MVFFCVCPASFAAAEASSNQGDVWRALSRLGYGPTPALISQVEHDGGARAWALREIDRAFAASQQPARLENTEAALNTPLPEVFSGYRSEQQARRAKRAVAIAPGMEPPAPASNSELADARIGYSGRMAREAAVWRLNACSRPDIESPLLARMTEFWFNHLNVSADKGAVRPFVGDYVMRAIRANALGQFQDLLLASSRHPAMLYYLDQALSVADGTLQNGRPRGLNENYARELMELHTLGAQAGYTQNDVRELARILTGWTIAPQQPDGFRFVARLHDSKPKVLLGHTFAATPTQAGEAEGLAAIRLLAEQAATAQRIALRLAQWFVSDQPPDSLVNRLADSLSASHGDMRSVMRTLVKSPEFWAPSNKLFKTSVDYVCSVLTASGGPEDTRAVNQALGVLNGAGQGIHRWPTPDGYKTDAATWLAPEALTRRADYAMGVARREPEVEFLVPFMQADTMRRIDAQAPKLRAGLLLASPDFMTK